jgi:hypothetical protein
MSKKDSFIWPDREVDSDTVQAIHWPTLVLTFLPQEFKLLRQQKIQIHFHKNNDRLSFV